MATDVLQVFSYLIANVSDLATPYAYRLQCHSCMSPYLEDQFMYISHLYRRPLAFTEKCDFNNFDGKYMRTKNCTDLCVSVRMNDKVGGRRRYGYMRGCMSDIIHYNRSTVRDYPGCYSVRLRDLFISSERYAFDPHDNVELCPCSKSFCNPAVPKLPSFVLLTLAAIFFFVFPKIQNFPLETLIIKEENPGPVAKSQKRRISRHSVLEIGVS